MTIAEVAHRLALARLNTSYTMRSAGPAMTFKDKMCVRNHIQAAIDDAHNIIFPKQKRGPYKKREVSHETEQSKT
jgi:hypothetical protein